MKSYFFKISFLVIFISAGITSCETSSGAKVKIIQMTKAGADTVNTGYSSDYQRVRAASNNKFTQHDRSISLLREKLKAEKNSARSNLLEQLNEFDQQNAHLKNGVDDYRESSAAGWEIFIQNYNSEMNDLEKSIAAFTEKYMNRN